jgi:geranylgeranyl transferase type-1 subunit beta
MTLAFFTISALDVLGILHTHTSTSERDGWIDWIYQCQLARGGFRAFPGTDFGLKGSVGNEMWDPADLAATFFALATLVVIGDRLERVRRAECLEWLRKLQRQDGSFGELLGEGGKIEGARDMRVCYMATGVRWILRGKEGAKAADGVAEDINVDALVGFINSSEVVNLFRRYLVLYRKADPYINRLTIMAWVDHQTTRPMVRIKSLLE